MMLKSCSFAKILLNCCCFVEMLMKSYYFAKTLLLLLECCCASPPQVSKLSRVYFHYEVGMTKGPKTMYQTPKSGER
jgi:hypothetical protein